jgi:plasmid stabilization system protein ParE
VYAGTRRVQQFPELGRIVPEYETPLVREIIVGRLRIWYVVTNEVRIIAVFHGARDTR